MTAISIAQSTDSGRHSLTAATLSVVDLLKRFGREMWPSTGKRRAKETPLPSPEAMKQQIQVAIWGRPWSMTAAKYPPMAWTRIADGRILEVEGHMEDGRFEWRVRAGVILIARGVVDRAEFAVNAAYVAARALDYRE